MCQLPRPPYEIHKMINLPVSVKITKNKLKKLINLIFRNNKLIKFLLNCVKESDFNSLHAWTTVFHIFAINSTYLKTGGCKVSYKLNVAPPAWLLDAVGYLGIPYIQKS